MRLFGDTSSGTNYREVEEITDSSVEFEDNDYQSNTDGKKSEWTTRKKLLLLAVCLINAVVLGTMSMIMPYFPTVAVAMGLSKTEIGFVFSSPALTGTFTSALTGMLVRRVNFKVLLCGGLVFAAAAQVMFGFGDQLQPGTPFAVWCFVFRILAAMGGFTSYIAVITILPQEFTTNYATVMGISEIFTGLGIAGAPALGGVIYQVGGYLWPAVTFGLLLLVIALLLGVLFWNTEFEDFESDNESVLQKVWELLKIPGVLIGAMGVLVGSVSFSVLEPIYAIFGNKVLHLNASQIGFIYTPVWISYLVVSGITGKLLDKVGNHLLIMFIGYVTGAIGFLLIGPAPLLDSFLPVGTIWLTVMADICIGVGQGLVIVPPLPYMIKSARDKGMPVDLDTSSLLSVIFTSCISLGVFIGPSLAGILADHVSVRMDFAIIGFVIATQAGILLLYGLQSSCKR